jgi:hypothetical protein
MMKNYAFARLLDCNIKITQVHMVLEIISLPSFVAPAHQKLVLDIEKMYAL